MDPVGGASLRAHFAALPDPRVARTRRHALRDRVRRRHLGRRRALGESQAAVAADVAGPAPRHPLHDTFGRAFGALDPVAVESCFLGWVRALAAAADGQVVAIDGKTLRRSHDRVAGRNPLHLVSAWAAGQRLVLGQVATADRSNEIVAIPALLDVLALEGATVTIGAMGCQRAIARRIPAGGADYVLALKDNQPTLHELVAHHVAGGDAAGLTPATHATAGKGHGRLEVRRCWATDDPEVLAWLAPARAWPGLRSVAAVAGERRIDGAAKTEARYYLSSLPADPARIAAAVRAHWGIENRLHWVLDMAFREDESRVRTGHAAENFAVLRHIALNLLRREPTAKVGIKAKRLLCGWDDTYLLKVPLA